MRHGRTHYALLLTVPLVTSQCFSDSGHKPVHTSAGETESSTTCPGLCTSSSTTTDATTTTTTGTDLSTDTLESETSDVTEGETEGGCGDGLCSPPEETGKNCPEDCFCGDNVCELAENYKNCQQDCGPSFSSLDWLSQDYVVNDPAADPYCVADNLRAEQGQWTPVRYLRRDADQRQMFTSFRVRAFHNQSHWTERVASTFDQPPYFEMQRGAEYAEVYGGDVFESEGSYVSIVGTSDANGVTGWYNPGDENVCQYGDAWVSYGSNGVPRSPGAGEVLWSDELATPIIGVEDPAVNVCPDLGGIARTRWTWYPKFSFASESACSDETHKRLDTIVSDHAADDLSHHEVFYFTEVYGMTRWERWNCSAEPSAQPPNPDYAAMRCDYEHAPSVMHISYPDPLDPSAKWQIKNPAGLYCTIVDCRDATFVTPVDAPGALPAAWQPSAHVYFAGNLLVNADFAWAEVGETVPEPWTHEGDLEVSAAAGEDENQYALLNVESDKGWLTQRISLTEYLANFGEGETGDLYIHYGGLVALDGPGERGLQIALSQWNINSSQQVTPVEIVEFPVTEVPQHALYTIPLHPQARNLHIRFRIDVSSAPALRVDDAFLVVDDTM